ncbi:MAG: YrhK family protein [Hyphomicrobiales bacterium]|nr:YrhK family protein [Hyphomicrobiales bacterium]
MFKPKLFAATSQHTRIYGFLERVYTVVDLMAAMFFLIGSISYFYPDLVYVGTWMFVIGSLLFALRPAVRFLREYHLASLPLPEDDRPAEE